MPTFKYYNGSAWVELAKKSDIPAAVTESTVSGWGFTKNAGTVTSVRVQAGTGLSSSTSSAQTSSLNTTISIASGYKLPTTTEWAGKQDALTAQTAYSAKGSATTVPQITTNALGQVTKISTVTITNSKTYKHDIIITRSSDSYKLCFTLYSATSTAFNITQAIQLLYNKPPVLLAANKVAAYTKSSVPLNIVVKEWTEQWIWDRHNISEVTYSGTSITNFTIGYCELGIRGSGANSLLTLSSASITFTSSGCTITDTVTLA